jgi:hypothetical protein
VLETGGELVDADVSMPPVTLHVIGRRKKEEEAVDDGICDAVSGGAAGRPVLVVVVATPVLDAR